MDKETKVDLTSNRIKRKSNEEINFDWAEKNRKETENCKHNDDDDKRKKSYSCRNYFVMGILSGNFLTIVVSNIHTDDDDDDDDDSKKSFLELRIELKFEKKTLK